MPPASPLARLRRIAAAAGAGQPIPADDARWLADALARYLEGAAEGTRLEDALGLAPAQGDPAWWTLEARARRDDLIREMAARFCTGSAWQRALTIADAARRYASTAWPRERHLTAPPTGTVGIRGLLFQAFKAHPRFPQSARQIRTIIEGADAGE